LPKRKIRFVLHSNRFEHLLAFSKQALFANLSGLKNFCNDIYFFPKEKNSKEGIVRKGVVIGQPQGLPQQKKRAQAPLLRSCKKSPDCYYEGSKKQVVSR